MAEKGIRNIGLFGHAGSGKTTIADGILYLAGANTRFGKVSEKTSAFDTDPEEQEKECSLNLGLATFNYQSANINLIDTPGYADFIGEAISGIEAVDCAIVVVDAFAGGTLQQVVCRVFVYPRGAQPVFLRDFEDRVDAEVFVRVDRLAGGRVDGQLRRVDHFGRVAGHPCRSSRQAGISLRPGGWRPHHRRGHAGR